MKITVDIWTDLWHNGFMLDKKSRWLSVLLTAKTHRELTVLALDEGITLAVLIKSLVEEFLENEEWQLQAISKASK